MLKIDAHHHLWRYTPEEFDWLQGMLLPLRRDFGPADLQRELQPAGVAGSVAVQARQTQQETDFLLEAAAATPQILGIVGWLPLTSADFQAELQPYAEQPMLKGLRHVVQGEPAGFMDGSAFRTGIGALAGSGLVYDILIYERQLEEATRLVDGFPEQTFVLDHIAKPRIADGEMEPWASRIRELAERPNVICKVSGMVTEADPANWSALQLRPYFEVVLEAFTPARLMAGSDWPVLLAGCAYQQWWDLLNTWVAELTPSERENVLAGTALRTYRLSLPQALTTESRLP